MGRKGGNVLRKSLHAATLWKSNVFNTLIVTYVLMLLLPIVLLSIAYTQSYDEFAKEIDKSNKVMLEQIRDTVDIQIQSARRVANEITVNPLINNFLNKSQPLDEDARANLINIINDMSILTNA